MPSDGRTVNGYFYFTACLALEYNYLIVEIHDNDLLFSISSIQQVIKCETIIEAPCQMMESDIHL